MPRRKSRTLTEVELEFMQVVWDLEEVTTSDVQKRLARKGRKLSDGAIRKILSILVTKGYLSRRLAGTGKSFCYWADVPQDQATKHMLVDLVDRAFRGSGLLMVAALLDSRKVSRADIKKIKQLIAKQEKTK